MKIQTFTAKIRFKFAVMVLYTDMTFDYNARQNKNKEIDNWCLEQFGEQNYRSSFNTFYLSTEEQRNWFILRWS